MGPLTEEEEALRRRAGRLLESLRQIPKVLYELRAWENDHETVLSLFRRGCLDGATIGILEAPLYTNQQIEDAWLFLFEMCQKHPNRRKQIEECSSILGASYNWSMTLRGSRKIRAALTEMSSTLRRQLLEAAVAHDLLEAIEVEQNTKMQTTVWQDNHLDSPMLLHGGPLLVDTASTSIKSVRGSKDWDENLCQQRGSNPFGSPSPCNRSAASSKPSSGRFFPSSSGTLSGASSASSIERKKASEESDGRSLHNGGGMHLTTPRKMMSIDIGSCSSGALPDRVSEKPAPAMFFRVPPKPNPNIPFRAEFNSDFYKKPPREEPVSRRGRADFAPWDRSGTYQVPPADNMFGPPVTSRGTRSEQVRQTPWPYQNEATPAAGGW